MEISKMMNPFLNQKFEKFAFSLNPRNIDFIRIIDLSFKGIPDNISWARLRPETVVSS